MKLLTPTATHDVVGQEVARDIIRIEEVRKSIKDVNIRLANAEADFMSTLARQREAWAKEEEEHAARKVSMQSEIEELENKRVNLLIPVGILQKSVPERLNEASDFLVKLRIRERDVQETAELLEDKLDAVGEREVDVAREEKKQKAERLGIEEQRNSIIAQSERMSAEIVSFTEKKKKEEEDLEKRKTAVFLRERTVEERLESIRRTESALNDADNRIQSERITLQKAWDELERKKNILQATKTE